jgi:hypothetical protein
MDSSSEKGSESGSSVSKSQNGKKVRTKYSQNVLETVVGPVNFDSVLSSLSHAELPGSCNSLKSYGYFKKSSSLSQDLDQEKSGKKKKRKKKNVTDLNLPVLLPGKSEISTFGQKVKNEEEFDEDLFTEDSFSSESSEDLPL